MKYTALFLLLFLPFTLSAENTEWFVGVEGGASGAKFSSDKIDSDRNYGPEYGIKIGLREENSRLYLGYSEAKYTKGDIETAKTPYLALEGVSDTFTVIGKSTAKFFFGVRAGASIADINGTDKTAFMGGLQTGLIFLLPADIEIELAYRHYLTYRERETDFDAGTLYGSLNYRFYAF